MFSKNELAMIKLNVKIEPKPSTTGGEKRGRYYHGATKKNE